MIMSCFEHSSNQLQTVLHIQVYSVLVKLYTEARVSFGHRFLEIVHFKVSMWDQECAQTLVGFVFLNNIDF